MAKLLISILLYQIAIFNYFQRFTFLTSHFGDVEDSFLKTFELEGKFKLDRGALRQQLLIPVGFNYFVVLMGLGYVGSDASQLSLPVLVVRAYGRRVVSRVKRSASMVCHALGVSLWGLGVPFVDCTGVPHSYCMLLWYLLCHGTRLSSRGSGS